MLQLASNYYIESTDTFAAPLPISHVPALHKLPSPPEQDSNVTISTNSRNVTQTTTSTREGIMTKVPEDLDEPYDATNPFLRLFGRINSLRQLQDDWNSYGSAAPNRESRFRARRVLEALMKVNCAPVDVTASSDEGIAIFFRSGNKRASIECLNSGEILGVLSEAREAPEVWTISADHLKHAVSRIQTFLTA